MGSDYFVEHVPQTQQVSCWAASTAMMLGYKNHQSHPESAVLEQFRDFGVDCAKRVSVSNWRTGSASRGAERVPQRAGLWRRCWSAAR
jgi:hypothetical protein